MSLRRCLVVVALVAAGAAALGLPTRATAGARVSGDEPQYLLTATSLVEDGDLDISDELDRRAYTPYHRVTVDQQTVPLDDTGRRVSPHDPLLPLVLAGPMGLGGWVAAKATLAVLAAVTAVVAAWFAVARLGATPAATAVVLSGTFAALPLAPYGTQVYPEMPAALVVVTVASVLTGPRLGPARAVAVLAGLVALPWLSVKYVPVAAVAGVALLVRTRARPRLALGLVVAAGLAGVVYLALHQVLYGGWTAYASGDHFVDSGEFGVVGTSVDLVGRSRRLVGLLVDRQFGLVPWAPVWALAPLAAAAAARRRDGSRLLVLGLVGAGWLNASFVALTMHGWWVPGRQLVVVLPLVAALVAWWVSGFGRRMQIAVAGAGILGATTWCWVAVESAAGRRRLIVDLADTTSPAYRLVAPLFPDGIRDSGVDDLLLAVWTVLIVVALVVGWRTARHPPPPSTPHTPVEPSITRSVAGADVARSRPSIG